MCGFDLRFAVPMVEAAPPAAWAAAPAVATVAVAWAAEDETAEATAEEEPMEVAEVATAADWAAVNKTTIVRLIMRVCVFELSLWLRAPMV